MKIQLAGLDGIPEKGAQEADGLRITLPNGAIYDISLGSLLGKDDCLRISAKHPGTIYTICSVPESISTLKVKALVVD